MTDFLTRFSLVGAAVSFAAWLYLVNRRRIARVPEFISRIPRSSLSVFLAAALVATGVAQKGGTNAPPNGASPPQMMMPLHPQSFPPLNLPGDGGVMSVTSNDVARGFLLESVITNDSYSFAMPTNGTRYARWWKRGGYEDVFRLDLDGMIFPLGTNLCSSLWVYTWGMAGARLADVSNRIAATGVPMSAVPFASQFWSAALPDGARRLTWQDFALNRDTNTPVSAQLDLYPSGDFIARSNLVETVYRRVNPDDWDDDGYPNDIDPNPYAFDEDGFGPHQELPQGANTNHYYWIDIVVDHANARVTFNGDGYSHLADPDFIAKAGETNRVMLLLGKSYTIDCVMPVRVVDREDSEIDVYACGSSVDIVWPVYVDFGPRMRSGGGVGATIWPARAAGGNFSWPDNFCCYSFAADATPIFDCDGTCGCGGCYTGDIAYEIGGHSMSYGGVHCGCSHEGDPEPGDDDPPETPSGPHVSVSFSKDTIVFEDEYTNSVNDVVALRSTDSELTCEVYGGTNGGHYAFALYDGGRLAKKSGSNLPRSGTVAAGETFLIKIKYEAQSASDDVGGISAIGTFTENDTGASLSSEATLTSVRVTLSSLDVSLDEYPNRHIRGIGEELSCEWTPSVSGLSFQTQNGAICTYSYGNRRDVTCPFHVASGICEVSVGGVTYAPVVQVLEPTGIEARNPHRLSYSVPVNSPGGAGFQVELYIMPDTVSFQALEFWERSAYNSTIEGYFTNQAFQAVWYHDTNMCAGVWHRISNGNLWFTDSAQMGDELITPVYPGRLAWHIPIDWRNRNDPTLIHQDFKSVDQVFEMSATGRLTVTKYQHWAAREMSGATFKSEGMTE